MNFGHVVGELQDLFGRYVLVLVVAPDGEATPPAAVLLGRLRRALPGETMLDELGEDDLIFSVGAEEPGARTCFFLSPGTFLRADWRDSQHGRCLVVESGHAAYYVIALDDQEDQIEAARSAASAKALREIVKNAREELERSWAEEEAEPET